ncbi:MAG TPA: VTT domain-containing protein, partial [Longimicrobiaceae bacterium]|nr:VTT domain-containing protein [Longimicrobiaceae bacterium]
VGRLILQPQQLQKLDDFYRRRGTIVIFVSRFLPMFRAVVPAFAGMSGISLRTAALPVLVASGLWYGLVVYVGATAGENWEAIRAGLESLGRWIYLVALLLAAAVAWVWWRSRDRSGART